MYAWCAATFVLACAAIGFDSGVSDSVHQAMLSTDPALQALTFLGDGRVLVPSCLLFALGCFFVRRSKTRLPLLALASIVLSSAITQLLKMLIGRPRPYALADTRYTNMTSDALQWFSVNKDFASFPSGHTTAVFSLAWFVITQLPGRRSRVAVFILACVVAFTRVALAKHYVADTLAGAAIGILISQALVDALIFI
ncbi:MAG: phosphatase PAP2 family protein [Deltaproteobacteria bacterium]|nr:phosphatase PAP2 family protein [Deltaproteobacteria bacterium]